MFFLIILSCLSYTYTQATVETLDHDFPSVGEGKLIPHELHNLARNEGYIHLNTSEFCCDIANSQ